MMRPSTHAPTYRADSKGNIAHLEEKHRCVSNNTLFLSCRVVVEQKGRLELVSTPFLSDACACWLGELAHRKIMAEPHVLHTQTSFTIIFVFFTCIP